MTVVGVLKPAAEGLFTTARTSQPARRKALGWWQQHHARRIAYQSLERPRCGGSDGGIGALLNVAEEPVSASRIEMLWLPRRRVDASD